MYKLLSLIIVLAITGWTMLHLSFNAKDEDAKDIYGLIGGGSLVLGAISILGLIIVICAEIGE